jgi:hypothetical protein
MIARQFDELDSALTVMYFQGCHLSVVRYLSVSCATTSKS